MAPKPTASSWTLLLKRGTTTVLLSATKDQPLSNLKADLLSALQTRHSDGRMSDGTALPSSAEEIELGRPIDPRDQSRGWVSLEESAEDDGEDMDVDGAKGGKGKGKARAKTAAAGTGPKDTPAGAGLRDGSAVAFRFAGEEEWDVRVPVLDYDEEDGGEVAG